MGFSVSGLAGSGKDTFADILCTEASFFKDHFAYDLKRIAKVYFNWDGEKDQRGRHLLQQLGTDVGRNYCKEIWLIKFGTRLGLSMPNGEALPSSKLSLDARLQYLAYYMSHNSDVSITKARLLALAEFGWNGLHDEAGEKLLKGLVRLATEYDADFWNNAPIDFDVYKDAVVQGYENEQRAKALAASGESAGAKLIVPDCRFPNELSILSFHSFIAVQVVRPGVQRMGHESETALDGSKFDVVINNDGSLDDLRAKAKKVLDMMVDGSLHSLKAKGQSLVL